MIKKNKTAVIISTLILLLPVIIGLLLWNKLPEQVPIHWNIHNEVDGWASKTQAVFFLPGFILVMHWVCLLVTGADPKAENINGKMIHMVLWVCPIISLIVSAFVYATALGYDLSIEVMIPLIMGGMFLIIGNYLPKCRRNYTIGIKLPWTLESDENWNATHRFAGFVTVLGGGVIMATAIFANWVIFFVTVAVLILAPTIYSYLYHRKKGTD